MTNAGVHRSFESSRIAYKCHCGWIGGDNEIIEWDIQPERNRAVRVCPACGRSVSEWGTHSPLDGVRRVARGPLQEALEAANR